MGTARPSRVSLLRDDEGKPYQSTGVQNKGCGHHRESTLSFAKPGPETKRLELVISDIVGTNERIFRWDLQ
jgi:hypothetical protein